MEQTQVKYLDPKDVRAEGIVPRDMPDVGPEFGPLDLERSGLQPGDLIIFRDRIAQQDSEPMELVRVVLFNEDRLIPPTKDAGCVAGLIYVHPEFGYSMASPFIFGELAKELRDQDEDWNMADLDSVDEQHVYCFMLEDGGFATTVIRKATHGPHDQPGSAPGPHSYGTFIERVVCTFWHWKHHRDGHPVCVGGCLKCGRRW